MAPVTYPLQNVTNLGLLGVAAVVGVALVLHPTASWASLVFPVIIVLGVAYAFAIRAIAAWLSFSRSPYAVKIRAEAPVKGARPAICSSWNSPMSLHQP